MNLKDTLWKLMQLGDCGVLDQPTRDAAKEAHQALSELRNLLELPATASASDMVVAVYQIKIPV